MGACAPEEVQLHQVKGGAMSANSGSADGGTSADVPCKVGLPYCPSCHMRGEPVECWICKMDMCFRCANPHGAKSLCDGCLKRMGG